MNRKIVKTGIACMLVTTLNFANFATVGTGLVSYALDSSVEVVKQSHENLGFSAYIKNEEGEKYANVTEGIEGEKNLYLNIDVEKEGYFNGEIQLGDDSNFEFVSSQSEYVREINSNTIKLNQVNANSTAEIEVTIRPKITETVEQDGEQIEKIDISKLNKESSLALYGVYKDRTDKDNKIEEYTKVQVAFVSENIEENAKSDIQVLTNKVGMYNGEEKRVVQVLAEVGVENNNYPIAQVATKISIPEPTQVQSIEHMVEHCNTTRYEVRQEENDVIVEMCADTENMKLNKPKEGKEKIILTFIYDKNAALEETEIVANSEIKLYDDKVVTAEGKTQIPNDDVVLDGIVTLYPSADEEIYKGKLYAGIDKEYVSRNQMQINLDKVAETINLEEQKTNIPTEYRRTLIDKNEFLEMFGENGVVEISTKNDAGETANIATITSTSETTVEEKFVEVKYPEGVSNIQIKTSKPQKTGTMMFTHEKVVKAGNKEEIKNTNQIETTVKGSYDTKNAQKGTIGEQKVQTNLKETYTKATLEVDRDSLSTIAENKNVEMKVTLNSNSEEYDLFSNPKMEIELPSDVKNVKINSINKLYGDEFTNIVPSQAEVDGKQVIKIEMQGNQTEYKEPGIDGTQIIINADLTLDNKATNKEEQIKMRYTNDNVNKYENEGENGETSVDMAVISPKDFIVTNNIANLGIETIGEQDKVVKELNEEASSKELTVESEIINNNSTSVNNVEILGTFGSDNVEKSIDLKLKSGIAVTAENTEDIKVYYTENEKATSDIENSENGWKDTYTEESKRYLIKADNMEVAEGIKLTYNVETPEKLDYDKEAVIGYVTGYTQNETGIYNEVKATDIQLKTDEAPPTPEVTPTPESIPTASAEPTEEPTTATESQEERLELKVEKDAFSGTNGEMQAKGNTSYIAKIKNPTNAEMKNVRIKWNLSNDVKIISHLAYSEEAYNKFNDPNYTGENDIKTLQNRAEETISSIPANSTVIVYILVQSGDIQESTKQFEVSLTATTPGNKTFTSNTETGIIRNNQLFTATLTANKEGEYVKAGETIEYTIDVRNNNDVGMTGLSVEDTVPKGLNVQKVTVNGAEQTVNGSEIKVPVDLSAGESKQIKIDAIVNYKSGAQDQEITNKAQLYVNPETIKETNTVSHEIVQDVELPGDFTKTQMAKDSQGYPTNGNGQNSVHKINGTAWEDENKDGKRDDNEKTLAGINVKLLDVSSNSLAKNPEGNDITATTDGEGNYELNGIEKGQYVALFEYDTSTYRLTDYKKSGTPTSRNSDVVAKTGNVTGEEKTYGVTDTIGISNNNVSNVNIGLARSEKFDLKLEKYIDKIVVQNADGTKEYDYDDETLAKVEIDRKKIQGSNVIIEYKIRVTNVGELDGYAKNIADYLPSELNFSSEINKDWYQEGNVLHNTSLANQKIAVGESKELKLTVSKTMTEENTGRLNNQAEIFEDYNSAGVTDMNSTPGNKAQGENDLGSADVIISIKTGEKLILAVLIMVAVVVLTAAAFFIKREIKMKEIM